MNFKNKILILLAENNTKSDFYYAILKEIKSDYDLKVFPSLKEENNIKLLAAFNTILNYINEV